MALSLNTSHPLYSNLKMLIGVDEGNVLVDLVTPSRTLTPDTSSPSAASFGTGAWGRHFRTGGQPYNPRGAALSPAFNPGNNTGTLVFVTHGLYGGNNDGNFWNGSPASIAAGNPVRIPSFTRQYGGNNFAAVINESGLIKAVDTGVSATSTADHMFTVARNGETSHAVYVDATSIASGGLFGYNDTTAANLSITRLGGTSGYGYFDCELVWLAWFDIALTAEQVADLYNSLGANNAFGLAQAAGNAAPTFPGPNIGNQTGTVGTALSGNNVASKFADSDALTFSAVGSWPPGVTVSSTGVISGTPTTAGTYSGLAVRATDTAAQTVDSDTFSFTIGAAAHLITVANSQQVNTGSSAAVQQAGNGIITLPTLKDWGTGNLKANETGVTLIINNATTGALVSLLTGQTTNASGVLPTLTGLVSGTAYRITTILADGSEGTWKYTAA